MEQCGVAGATKLVGGAGLFVFGGVELKSRRRDCKLPRLPARRESDMPDKQPEDFRTWLLLLQDVWPIGVAFLVFIVIALPFFIEWFH
jgi:hypothetical protein